jgi:hypothetical protein
VEFGRLNVVKGLKRTNQIVGFGRSLACRQSQSGFICPEITVRNPHRDVRESVALSDQHNARRAFVFSTSFDPTDNVHFISTFATFQCRRQSPILVSFFPPR